MLNYYLAVRGTCSSISFEKAGKQGKLYPKGFQMDQNLIDERWWSMLFSLCYPHARVFLYVFWQSTYVGIFVLMNLNRKIKYKYLVHSMWLGHAPGASEPLFGYRFCYQIFTIVKDNDIHLFSNIHIHVYLQKSVCCFEVVVFLWTWRVHRLNMSELDVYTGWTWVNLTCTPVEHEWAWRVHRLNMNELDVYTGWTWMSFVAGNIPGWRYIYQYTGLEIYLSIYRVGDIFINIPGWRYIYQYTGLEIYLSIYRVGDIFINIPGWRYIYQYTGLEIYLSIYRVGDIFINILGWRYIYQYTGLEIYLSFYHGHVIHPVAFKSSLAPGASRGILGQ